MYVCIHACVCVCVCMCVLFVLCVENGICFEPIKIFSILMFIVIHSVK